MSKLANLGPPTHRRQNDKVRQNSRVRKSARRHLLSNKQTSMRVNKHLECSTVRREMRASGASDDWIKGERGIKMEIREEAKEPPSFHLRAFGDERWRRPYCILEWWKIKALRSQKYRWGGSDTYRKWLHLSMESRVFQYFYWKRHKDFLQHIFLFLRISSLVNFRVVVFQQVTRSVSARPETPQGEWREKPSLGKQTSLWLMRQNPFVSFL